MKMWTTFRDQSGDTIVEVLIALAVISSVLAGAFLVAQKSTTAVRDSQEHGEMQQLLQGQIELVRSMALVAPDTNAPIFATSPKYFCISAVDPLNPLRVSFPASFVLPPSAADDTYANYPAECKNQQTRYNIAISYNNGIFNAVGRWDRINGGKDQISLVYRVAPGQVAITPPPVAPPPVGAGDAAFISVGDCGAPLPPCPPKNPPGGFYRYNVKYINQSNNDPLTVSGCQWNWGDGVVTNYPATDIACQFGGSPPIHNFPKTPELAYPASCQPGQGTVYTVILTMHFKSLPDKQYAQTPKIPYCAATP